MTKTEMADQLRAHVREKLHEVVAPAIDRVHELVRAHGYAAAREALDAVTGGAEHDVLRRTETRGALDAEVCYEPDRYGTVFTLRVDVDPDALYALLHDPARPGAVAYDARKLLDGYRRWVRRIEAACNRVAKRRAKLVARFKGELARI